MLNALRRGAKGVLAKILIALLVMSFAVWGISDFVNQIDPSEVARAGDTPVTTSEFARVYQRVSNRTSQQMGTGLTPEQAQAIGLPNQVLSTMITDALQVDAAHALGVDLGDDALAERIRSAPVFAGADGSFDNATFERILAENRYSEAEFVALERAGAAQEMLVNALVGGLEAPTPYVEAINRYLNQERVVAWFRLDQEALGPIADPSEEALRTYYDEHADDFRAPEYRAVSTVTLSAEALADPEVIEEADVRAAYERSDAYGEPERRRVQQVVLDDPAIAEKAAGVINDGAAFAAVLKELGRSFKDVDLGLVERADLVDPAVAEAAFALEAPGAVAVEGRFGPVLVRVAEIEEAARKPFGEVADELRAELARDEAADEVRGLYNDVEDAVAGGARVDEIAERFDLPLATIEAVTREGLTPEGNRVQLPAQAIAEAFAAAEGDDAVPVREADATTWVQLDAITPAADRAYEDVANAVLLAWTEAERATRLDRMAQEALEAVRGGTSVEEVAATYAVEPQTTEPFSRGAPPQSLPQAAVEAAFEGPVGHADAVATEDGARIVLKVTDVAEPAFFEAAADVAGIDRTLSDGVVNALRSGFVAGWQEEVGATLNQPVINQIIGLDQSRQ